MPVNPVAALGAVEMGVSLIGEVAGILREVNSGRLSDQDGQRRIRDAGARLNAADSGLDVVLADNDRRIDSLPKLPEPTAPASPALVPVAPPPVGGPAAPPAAGPEPTGES